MTALLLTALLAAPGGPRIEVRVDGAGVLRFVQEGRVVYSKSAMLVATQGRLAHASGAVVMPTIPTPEGIQRLAVDLDGTVRADANGRAMVLGRLVIAVFPDEARLMAMPGGLLIADTERPRLMEPGDGLTGVVRTVSAPVAVPKIPATARPNPAVPRTSPTGATPSGRALIEPSARPLPVLLKNDLSVVVHLTSDVETSQFTLGQIAEINAPEPLRSRLASLAVGDVPPLGVPRLIDQARLRSRLLGNGVDLRDLDIVVPAGARVQRPFQIIDSAQILDAATNAARNKFGLAGTWAPVKGDVPSPKVVPGDVVLSAVDANGSDLQARVLVHILVNGTRATSVTVELARQGVLASPRLGSVIKVRVRSGGAVIETSGTVARTARSGEPVEVQLANGERMSGTLVAAGTVEVTL